MPSKLARIAAAFLLALQAVPCVVAAGAPQEPVESEPAASESRQAEADPVAEQEAETDDDDWDNLENDPCAIGDDGNWIDWMNRRVTKSVCGSARWFDNFFGTSRGDEDRDATFGRIGLGGLSDEDDGFDPVFRFRAKVHFPNMDDRVHAVMGRGNIDDILSEEGPTDPPQEAFFDDESEWLLGFGFRLNQSNRNRFDLSLGTSFSDSALDPYVRLRYIYTQPIFNQAHLRIRVLPQWQKSLGYGVTAKIGIDRSIGERMLLRWELNGRDFEKRLNGLSYGTNLQLFQSIGIGRAMRYIIGYWGQTGYLHQPEDWGLQVTFRDSIYKEILFIEFLGGVNFRRRDEDPEREAKWLAGLFFELKFGK